MSAPIPEHTTIMNFRRVLKKHQLAPAVLAVINGYLQGKGLSPHQGIIDQATIIRAYSSTRNEEGKRNPKMQQTEKGNEYFFEIEAQIGTDIESGLVHHFHGTVPDVTQVVELSMVKKTQCKQTLDTPALKREEHGNCEVVWQIAVRRSKYSELNKRSVLYKESARSSTAKLRRPPRSSISSDDQAPVWNVDVRFRWLMNNMAQLITLFALSNLWMARNNSWVWVSGRSRSRDRDCQRHRVYPSLHIANGAESEHPIY